MVSDVQELEALYVRGWRGSVFIVDDNFIGNRKKLKTELLPALIAWSRKRHYPFAFTTEASMNLADDEELVRLMVEAGFEHTFIGIETPNPDSLADTIVFIQIARAQEIAHQCPGSKAERNRDTAKQGADCDRKNRDQNRDIDADLVHADYDHRGNRKHLCGSSKQHALPCRKRLRRRARCIVHKVSEYDSGKNDECAR